jgi:hypothetical protein
VHEVIHNYHKRFPYFGILSCLNQHDHGGRYRYYERVLGRMPEHAPERVAKRVNARVRGARLPHRP